MSNLIAGEKGVAKVDEFVIHLQIDENSSSLTLLVVPIPSNQHLPNVLSPDKGKDGRLQFLRGRLRHRQLVQRIADTGKDAIPGAQLQRGTEVIGAVAGVVDPLKVDALGPSLGNVLLQDVALAEVPRGEGAPILLVVALHLQDAGGGVKSGRVREDLSAKTEKTQIKP